VVGTSFNDVVDDATKDVFILFHSPYCAECPAVNKKFHKVAKKVHYYCYIHLIPSFQGSRFIQG